MKRIYVSLRKDDTSETYGRLAERLREYFGSESVRSTDLSYSLRQAPSQAPGATPPDAVVSAADYRAYVAKELKQCAVLLALIGPHWLASSAPGGWDMASPDDPIRIEIEEALRAAVPVIPVLVQRGVMPQRAQLPPSVALMLEQDERSRRHKSDTLLALVSRAGLPVRSDPDFGGDTQRLCEIVENLAGIEATSPQRAVRSVGRSLRQATLVGAGALTAHALILAYFAYHVALTMKPSVLIPAQWLSQVVSASVIDLGIYFLIGYIATRRTGDMGTGVIASVVAYVIALVVGLGVFVDIAWTNWQDLTAYLLQSTPSLLVGTPGWLLTPTLLLMRPLLLTCAVLILGAPLGLLLSLCFGWMGGSLATDVASIVLRQTAQRQRRALIEQGAGATQAATSLRQFGSALFRRQMTSASKGRHGPVAGKVFISYRRDDSSVMCGAIYDRLTQAFGIDTIFKDVDMIPVGVNFEKYITRTLKQCVAQVVVIGPQWVDIRSVHGERRLDDPADFVRVEVESALRDGLAVIPVLVQGATLPSAEELPASLRPLVEREPVAVHYAPAFDGDMRALSQKMAPILWPEQARRSLLRRLFSLRTGASHAERTAALWLMMFAFFGLVVGRVAINVLLQGTGQVGTWQANLLASALASAPILTALCAAQSAYVDGRTVRATWLSLRAAAVGAAAFALMCQVGGWLALSHGGITPLTDPTYRLLAAGAPLIAGLLLLGPQLFVALIASAIAATIRQARSSGRLLSRATQRILIIARTADSPAETRMTADLVRYFGRRILPHRLDSGVQRISSVITRQARRLTSQHATLLARFLPSTPSPASSTAITRTVRGSAVVLALVGRGWAQFGQPDDELTRADNPTRQYIEAALGLGVPIVPIFLTGASMPAPSQLPVSIREFAMLNGASVRDGSDYAGDVRRLARVIERLTPLRPRRRFTQAGMPMFLGALVSAVALTCFDCVGTALALLAIDQLGQNAQSRELIFAAGIAILDIVVYAVTGVLVARSTGSRLSGALASIAGGAVGAIAGIVVLHVAPHALQSILINEEQSVTTGLAVDRQFVADAITFAALRAPLALLLSALLGTLGALYGRIAYRGRERRQQERRLYEMARSSIQASAQVSTQASTSRAGSEQTTLRRPRPASAPPAPSVLATASVDSGLVSGADAPSLADSDARTEAMESPAKPLALDALVNAEIARRERLRAEMAQAHVHVQARRMTRIGIVLAGALVIALGAALISGQVYRGQVVGVAAQATTVSVQGTVVAAQTETAVVYVPYATSLLGSFCANDSADWEENDTDTYVDCPVGATATTLAASTEFPVAGELQYSPPRALAPKYSVKVDTANPSRGACAGLVSDGDSATNGVILYQLCTDGYWQVVSYSDAHGQHVLTHGHTSTRPTNHLEIDVFGAQRIFKVNGIAVADLTGQGVFAPDFVGVCVGIKVGAPVTTFSVNADFSNFSYAPLR